MKICNLLTEKDRTQNCPLCHKKEWGEAYHDDNCPFAYAYDTLEKIKKYEIKQSKLKTK